MQILDFQAGGATVRAYLHENHEWLDAHRIRPAAVILAGGAYRWISPREQDPVALFFAAMGYQTFLLDYSVGERAGGFRPLEEAAESIRAIRENAEAWHTDPGRIALIGFSAGGHLAASLGILWKERGFGETARPDAIILCYPVITAGAFREPDSIRNVTGEVPELLEMMSLEHHVTADMPPTFLWHSVKDETVPVENSILLLNAMQEAGVPYECHLFAEGAHGNSMCTREVETPDVVCAQWKQLCAAWLNRVFEYEP